jgi:hypothetical protein
MTPADKADSAVKILNFIKQVISSVNDGKEVANKIWEYLTKEYY